MKNFKDMGFTPTPTRRVQKSGREALPLRSVSGFTLIELLIVIAIVGVLAVAGMTNYFGTRNRIVFESQVVKIAADLQATRERSRVQESGDQWGIHFENPAGAGSDFYDIWHGISYAAGTTTSRSVLSPGVEFTIPGPSSTLDVIFAKATGLPTASPTIVLQSLSLGNTATIIVSAQGTISFSITAGGGGNGASASAPAVITNSASNVATSTATLNGSANPNGAGTTGWFRYDTSPGTCNETFGTVTVTSSLGSGTSSVPYSQGITGLTVSTPYYYCAIAENSEGKSFGSVVSFTTNSISNSVPAVSSVTDLPTPVDIGTSISFDIAWSDADLDSAKGIVCKTDFVTAGATPSCPGTEWAGPSALTSNGTNINLSFVPTFNNLGPQNYHVFVCDPEGDCSLITDPNDGTFDVKAGLIPGTTEAENYNLGGEGVAYHDTTAGNSGNGTCRNDDVDMKAATSGCIIGFFATGEWLKYDVNIAVSGTYLLEARVSNGIAATHTFFIEQDGVDVTGPVSVDPTGSWDTFAIIQHPGVSLSAGNHTLRLVSDDFFDIDWMRWSAQ